MHRLTQKQTQFRWWNGHLRRITPHKPLHFLLCLIFSPLWLPAVFVLLGITGVLEVQINRLRRAVNENNKSINYTAFRLKTDEK